MMLFLTTGEFDSRSVVHFIGLCPSRTRFDSRRDKHGDIGLHRTSKSFRNSLGRYVYRPAPPSGFCVGVVRVPLDPDSAYLMASSTG